MISAEGCTNIELPEGAEAEREGEVMNVKCKTTKKTWTLHCVGNDWDDIVDTCNIGKSNKEISRL